MKFRILAITAAVILNLGCTGLIGLETGNRNFDLLYGIAKEVTKEKAGDDDCKIADPEARYSCYEKVQKRKASTL